MSAFTILLVDDYEPFRRLIYSMLEKTADFHVVGEASNGLEGIHKAKELKPDLILLDICMPQLNGLQVAKCLREFVPRTTILFLSQETQADVLHESLDLGALGYVHKSRVNTELFPAIKAVLAGKRFVSDLQSSEPESLQIGSALTPRF